MLIREACSVALYCQRCGKIHVQDIPCFSVSPQDVLRCDSCGHEQAILQRLPGGLFALTVGCVGCGTENRVIYSLKALRRLQLEKLYCRREHFELGYLGRRRRIEELLAFNQAEFEALHPNDGINFIEKQRVLLEALNRVHEMAALGAIACPCGNETISAYIRGNSIVLECGCCGSSYVLRAEEDGDLARLGRGFDIGLIAPGRARSRT
ncbi:MAG: hypothetical protein IJS96_09010 [Schwartzia sp.]|nr:hypothetical protein [Schwartzia sp. (in: firmicutes)]